jgi:beta-lactamase superfamily II metal-dependent hydrolase
MTEPAKNKWWDDVVSVDSVKLDDDVYLLWGDRVRVLEKDIPNKRVRVFGRGTTGWIQEDALGGEPLLELYFIDVGQGDGILVVTPEGHHLMVDGGHQRSRQQTGKSAADFVDWKFHKDYLHFDERDDPEQNKIRLDAMIATHADADHYGGLRDLIDRDLEDRVDELNSEGVTVEAFYHPGLCPQQSGPEELGDKSNGYFIQLLGDRTSAEEGLKDHPQNAPKIRGWWRDFISAVVEQNKADGNPTSIIRLSHNSGFLPGFAESDATSVKIRVLAPIEADVEGKPGLRDLGNEGENKNGHSIALRLDYKDRRILLTGDLNDQSQEEIMAHYGAAFGETWSTDVFKACHHGSHHVDYTFLKGIGALSTVFSSGDANTYDHPRAWVLGAAALPGRVIEDPEKARLKAPLVYSTEIARSLTLGSIDQLREYENPQPYGKEKDDPVRTISGEVTTSKWRTILDRDSQDAKDMPPAPAAKVMRNIIYGLVNVRTDGERLLFAVRNEGNASWAYETMEPEEIATAYRIKPDVAF